MIGQVFGFISLGLFLVFLVLAARSVIENIKENKMISEAAVSMYLQEKNAEKLRNDEEVKYIYIYAGFKNTRFYRLPKKVYFEMYDRFKREKEENITVCIIKEILADIEKFSEYEIIF